uniref:Uncharacterized protein n=1 Tax=Nelumbo nucifera TaxID=4432 RepID=A0A822Y8W3_NELNU|nr:TPA_asm: hypothetical protein HUJ06_029479 [Nelumbo nucifera]
MYLISLGGGDLNVEPWRACAGPLVNVPHSDEILLHFNKYKMAPSNH